MKEKHLFPCWIVCWSVKWHIFCVSTLTKTLIFIMQIEEVRSILPYQEGGGHSLVMLQLMTYQKGTVFIFLVMLIWQMNLRVFPGTVHGRSSTKHRTWLQHRVGKVVPHQQLVTHHKDLNRWSVYKGLQISLAVSPRWFSYINTAYSSCWHLWSINALFWSNWFCRSI